MPFPNSYIDILSTRVIVARGKSFEGKLTKSWEWDPQEWDEHPHERGPREFLIFPSHDDTKTLSWNWEKGPYWSLIMLTLWSWTYSPRNKCLLLPSLWLIFTAAWMNKTLWQYYILLEKKILGRNMGISEQFSPDCSQMEFKNTPQI